MRLLTLWLDRGQHGCGERMYLLVREGRKLAHLLDVSTLEHVKVPLEYVTRYGHDIEPTRGFVKRLKARMRAWTAYGYKFPRAFVKEALKGAKNL